TREGGHPSTDVDGDPAHVVSGELDLAGVHARADLDLEVLDGIRDRSRATDGSRRPVEGCKEAIARDVDLAASVASEEASHERVVTVKERSPPAVSELGRLLRRPDDVCEHHGCQYSFELGLLLANVREEPLHRVQHAVGAVRPEVEVGP